MGLDFDVITFCQNLKATKPPYECPVPNCRKVYKSYSGIQFHMYNYDHDNPENNVVTPTKDTSKKPSGSSRKHNRKSWHHRANRRSPTPPDFLRSPTGCESLTYAEAQRLVEVDLDGRMHRINIYEPLEIISQDEIDNCDNTEKEEKPEKSPQKSNKDVQKPRKETSSGTPHPASKLPEASFKIIDDYVRPVEAPPRPQSYFRFIERTAEELDDEIEYDMDEEDYAWLQIVNEKRKGESVQPVTQETFETLMDRFEKEAYFQSQTSGKDPQPSIDEDAVCSICMDGECQNSNVILFCDMCNLAVHQECYGVPYIPEGQWLCRRCLQSPSRAVDCCLCPNKGGAFKQTDDGRWAHVVCALWIPEVGFANTVFLEPIDSIEHIPPARWKLTCYICKQRGTGSCIQCHKTNCYTAFHVTCAQQAGLFMKIEPVRETGINGTSVSVRKTAFCDVHTPADGWQPMMDNGDENEEKSISVQEAKAKSRQKMRKARKILAEKRNAVPIVSIPFIPSHRLSKIISKVSVPNKKQFIIRLQSYWTLKRQSRNGVPLLRRLQSNHMSRNKDQTKNDKQSNALKAQLKYWQRLRQDLEKARLLVELIRKREKLKREEIRIQQLCTEMKLQPFVVMLRSALEQLEDKDVGNIFAEPVSLDEVPDYLNYIKKPMDFSTMRAKMEGHEYNTIDEFEADFELIINNCMTYNAKDTVFYRAAIRLRDQGGAIIRATRRMVERIGFDPETGMHTFEAPKQGEEENTVIESALMALGSHKSKKIKGKMKKKNKVDSFLPPEVRQDMPLEEQLRILLDKLDMANAMRMNRKSKLAKQIRKEIIKVRRQLALQRGQLSSDQEDTDYKESIDAASSGAASTTSSRSPSPAKSARSMSPEPVKARSPPPKSPKSPSSKPQSSKSATKGSARGRGRTRARQRTRSTKSESETELSGVSKGGDMNETSQQDTDHSQSNSSQSKDSANEGRSGGNATTSPSPSGVNRRTSVLFSKKASFRKPLQLGGSQPRKSSGRPPRPKGNSGICEGPSLEADIAAQCADKGPGSPSMRKRSASASHLDSSSSGPPTKRSMSVNDACSDTGLMGSHRESFTQYRSLLQSCSDTESTSDTSSNSDSSLSDSCSSKNSHSDLADGDGSTHRYSRRVKEQRNCGRMWSLRSGRHRSTRCNCGKVLSRKPVCAGIKPKATTKRKTTQAKNERKIKRQAQVQVEPDRECKQQLNTSAYCRGRGQILRKLYFKKLQNTVRTKARCWGTDDEEEEDIIPLEPLDLVWAKCRGYPWYPALIINPKMPKTGYFHNGVPIPVPPDEVLALQKKHEEPVYLVLFFDTKRTWQWLPRNKLEPLGVDSGLDTAKLLENKKPNVRKAVKKAYEKAILHRCRVTGEPNPLSGESETED